MHLSIIYCIFEKVSQEKLLKKSFKNLLKLKSQLILTDTHTNKKGKKKPLKLYTE